MEAGAAHVDCGSMCLPGLREKVHELVEDARAKGARVLAGGTMPTGPGQFYPPTVVADVTQDMRLWREEAFGPIMCIASFSNYDEGVRSVQPTSYFLSLLHSRLVVF
jgi:acyl-CoA reductase-like NAD-dependent aldehyde dehydrogenase